LIYEIYSFDFDGALANLQYLASKEKDIISANIDLLNQIKASIHNDSALSSSSSSSSSSSPSKKSKLIVFVGSNRQGLIDDFGNSTADERGSCYPAIKQISEYLDAKLDYMLLGDLFNNLPDGTCFKKALKLIDKRNNRVYTLPKLPEGVFFPDWLHDDSKLCVIYAQMHKMSLEHPYDTLNYNFLDDRDDLLQNLHEYFLKYPEMIPHNVTLKLKKYTGPIDIDGNKIDPLITEFAPIKGARPYADGDYRQTVKTMAAVTIEQMTEQNYDLLATNARHPITTYAEAQNVQFNMTAIKCVQYYKPGMLPASPPEVPAQSKGFRFFGRTFFSSSNLPISSIKSPHHASSLSPRPSSSSSSSLSHTPAHSDSFSSIPSPKPTPSPSSKFVSDPGPSSSSPTSSFESIPSFPSIALHRDEFDLSFDTLQLPIEPPGEIDELAPMKPIAQFFTPRQPTPSSEKSIGRHRLQLTTLVNKEEEEKEESNDEIIETPNQGPGTNLD
jgi:hypothetical protein